MTECFSWVSSRAPTWDAPIAQLDRALVYGTRCRKFESSWARPRATVAFSVSTPTQLGVGACRPTKRSEATWQSQIASRRFFFERDGEAWLGPHLIELTERFP